MSITNRYSIFIIPLPKSSCTKTYIEYDKNRCLKADILIWCSYLRENINSLLTEFIKSTYLKFTYGHPKFGKIKFNQNNDTEKIYIKSPYCTFLYKDTNVYNQIR